MVQPERLAAWVLLSDLFLDTSFDDDYRRILAARLSELPFTVAELENILHQEVAPAFAFNLMDIAGEWAGWSDEDVAKIVARSQRPRFARRWRNDLKARLAMPMVQGEWLKVAALINVDQ